MSKKQKPIRLLTNRAFPVAPKFPDRRSVEWLEIDDLGTIYWKADDYLLSVDGSDPGEILTSASFPVTLEFAKEKFAELGRTLDESKLPANVRINPYAHFL